MSAYKTVECDIVDLECLLDALKLLGFNINQYEKPENLKGYQNDIRDEKATIIIPKEQINFFTGASNDIGFIWNQETEKFDMIISDYDKKFKMDIRIIQAYIKVVLEKELEKNGFKIKVNINNEDLLKRSINDLNIIARKII